jgi:predicted MFS family arabinose efflux permease
VLVLDALSFLAIVPLVVGLGSPADHRAEGDDDEPTTVRSDALEGLRHLWGTPALRALAVGFWIIVLASASDDLLLVFLGSDTLHARPSAVGVLLSAASIGLLVGLATIVPWTRRRGLLPIRAVLLGFALVSVGNLLTAAAPALAVAFATQLVRGGGIALLEANVRTHVQRSTPRRLLGRTLANLYGGVSVMAALGYVIGGPMLDATDPRTMFVVIGSASLVATALSAALLRGHAGRDAGAPEGPLDATAG